MVLDHRAPVAAPPPRPRDAAPCAGRPPRLRAGSSAGEPSDPAWVRPALLALLVGDGAPLPLRPRAPAAMRTRSTRPRSRPATKSWKAFFFGSFDSSNFITVDKPPASLWVDGHLGADLRPQLVEHPRAPGARGRRRGRAALRSPCGAGSRAGAALLGGAVLALTPGRGADVPLQQPRRAAGAAAHRRRLRAPCAALEAAQTCGWSLAGALRRASASSPRCCRRSSSSPASRSSTCSPRRRRCAGASAAFVRGRACSSPAGWWVAIVDALAGGGPALHRRLAGQQHPQPDLRLQRLRPDHRQRDRAAWAGGTGRREHVGPDRHHPSLRRRVRHPDLLAPPGALLIGRRAAHRDAAGPRTDRARAPRSCSGAAPW